MGLPTYHAYRHVADTARTGDFWGTVARELAHGGFTDTFHILVATFDFAYFFASLVGFWLLFRYASRLWVMLEALGVRRPEPKGRVRRWLYKDATLNWTAGVTALVVLSVAETLLFLGPWLVRPH